MSRRVLAAAVVIVALVSVQALGTTYTDPASVGDVAGRLTKPLPAPAALPAVPSQGGVAALAAAAGPQHAQKILDSGIPNDYAWRVVRLLEAIRTCPASRNDAAALACAEATSDAAAALVRTEGTAFADIQLWPLLYIDGDGGNTVYRHDYVVIIDRGGNDLYDNNAGGNLVDQRRGPAGSAAPVVAPAIGCEQVQGNFPAPTVSVQDCIAVPQAVLIDYRAFGSSSNDLYGLFKPPRTVDHNPAAGPRIVDGACTRDPLVRRIVTGGAGFQGNGFLMDVTGNDVYPGKTSALGAGHVGGVGVLRDLGGGRDLYIAIRNSQGFALAGGVGVLQDDGGNDTYSTYMPRPKNPRAAFQQPGSGGVVDDTGLCDNLPRMVQGTALAGGAGILLDQGGSDRYQGAPDATQPFNPQIQFFHSSQGFGCAAGIGILRDTGNARDTYRQGPSNRADGFSTVVPETTCLPAVPGVGVFSDDGP